MDPQSVTPLAAWLKGKMTDLAIPSAAALERQAADRQARISRMAIGDILNGKTRNPSTRALCALATGLGVNVCEIMPAACETARLDEAA